MKIHTFVTGVDEDGNPALYVSGINYPPKHWVLIDTREHDLHIDEGTIQRIADEVQAIDDDL